MLLANVLALVMIARHVHTMRGDDASPKDEEERVRGWQKKPRVERDVVATIPSRN